MVVALGGAANHFLVTVFTACAIVAASEQSGVMLTEVAGDDRNVSQSLVRLMPHHLHQYIFLSCSCICTCSIYLLCLVMSCSCFRFRSSPFRVSAVVLVPVPFVRVLPCLVSSRLVMSCLVLSCPVLSCPALPCPLPPALPCPVSPRLASPRLVLSYPCRQV